MKSKEKDMIEGRYEMTIHFDNNGRNFTKSLQFGNLVVNAEDFMTKLIQDIQDCAPILDKYLTNPEEEDASV